MSDMRWVNMRIKDQASVSKEDFRGPAWCLRGHRIPFTYCVLIARRDGFYFCTAEAGMGTKNMKETKLEGITRIGEAKAVAAVLAKME